MLYNRQIKAIITAFSCIFICCQLLAQEKTILFNEGYSVSCSVVKKALPEDSHIRVSDSVGQVILDGTVDSFQPTMIVYGKHSFKETADAPVVECEGQFIVSNTADGTFILDKKKGGPLKVLNKEIKSASFTDGRKTVFFTDHSKGSMLMNIKWKPSDSNAYYKKQELKVRVPDALIQQYGFTDILSIQRNTKKGYEFIWTNGKSFKGNIDCYDADDGSFYHMELGEYETPNITESIENWTEPGSYLYKSSLHNVKDGVTDTEIVFLEDVMIDYGYWNTNAIYAQGVSGKFTMANGDVFEGNYSVSFDGNSISGISFLSGKYMWSNGDIFVGDLQGGWLRGRIPLDGTLTLQNGKVFEGEWWKDKTFQLTDDEWAEFDKGTTPTEQIMYAYQVQAVKIINATIPKINDLISKNKIEDALALVRKYKDIASFTEAAQQWTEIESSLTENFMHIAAEYIANALREGNFSNAIAMALRFNGNSLPVPGPETYKGDLKFEDLHFRNMGYLAFWTEHGYAEYSYKPLSNGRLRQGSYFFSNNSLTYYGYYNEGKMDAAWIYECDEIKAHTISIQSYKDGVPNGIFVRVGSESYGWQDDDPNIVQYCVFENGRVASDMFYDGARIRFDNDGKINDKLVGVERNNGVNFYYVFNIVHGNVVSVEMEDKSLGTKTQVYPGQRLKDFPVPKILKGMTRGMLQGVIYSPPYEFD